MSELSIRRPVLVLMILTALLVLGLVSRSRLPIELFPSVEFPFVSVITTYPGADPEEIETLITRPIEDQVASITNLRRLRSFSQEGVSFVGLELQLGTSIDSVTADVRQRVDAVRARLPRDADDPVVQKFDFSTQPVMQLGFGGSLPPQELRRLAEDVIKPRVERVAGVAAVSVAGGRTREILVEVDQNRLRAYGLVLPQVEQALRSENLSLPAGRIREGEREVLVRITGQFRTLDQIGDVRIRRADGVIVPLREVAAVRDTTKAPTQLTRLNGRESVGISVQKQAGANTVAVADGVRGAVTELRRVLPAGTEIAIARDDSLFIRDSVDDVQSNLVLGSILATIVVFLFLHNLRSTVIIGLALPASIVATFILMYFSGFTLNVMSLLGLAIAIGLMTDNAIVVNENINRHLETDPDPATAARLGAREIEGAVIASNLANIAVFLPIAFVGGLVGQFFRQFGLTVAFANLFSIVVGFTLTPMLSARWLRTPRRTGGRWERLTDRWDSVFEAIAVRYTRLLAWSLRRRGVVVGAAMALFVASLALAASPLIGKEFFPPSDQGQFSVTITMPGGAALAQTDRATREVERLLRTVPEVTTIFSVIGATEDVFGSSEGSGQAQILVALEDRPPRVRSSERLMQEVRALVAGVPAETIQVGQSGITGASAPIQIEITGADRATLTRLATQVEEIVRATPGTVNVDTSEARGKQAVAITLDRERLAMVGLTSDAVAAQVRSALAGTATSRYRVGGTEIDITVRAREADRNTAGAIEDLHVGVAPNGAPVRLGDVAAIEQGRSPAQIQRKDRQRLAVVSAALLDRPLGSVVAEIQAKLRDVAMPPGYAITFGGEAEFQAETFSDMFFALILGVLFVYMTMAAQMNSLRDPLVIMFTLPLASVGVFLFLLLTRTSISMMSLLGIIMLAGIVVNNAIILVDFVTQLRRQGLTRRDALLEAGRTRLRPILMTAFVSILGGLPVALGLGAAGAEWRRPLGIAVLGGLLTSTFLTLLVIPVVYTLLEDALAWAGRLGRREREAPSAAAPMPVAGGANGEESP